jgi:hypothetical protein
MIGEWTSIDSRYVSDMLLSVKRSVILAPSSEPGADLFLFVVEMVNGDFSFQVKEMAASMLELCLRTNMNGVDALVESHAGLLLDAEDLLNDQSPLMSRWLSRIGLFDKMPGLW